MEKDLNGTLKSVADAGMNKDTYSSSCDGLEDFGMLLLYGFILVICSVGFLGNGTVIWLLGFRIRRNPFTTYIFNLAVADFAFLLSLEFYSFVSHHPVLHIIGYCLLAFTYNTGQLLLTVLSIDRCVSVLFPIWHRCAQPTHLSTTVCALIWVVSCLLSIILSILQVNEILPHIFEQGIQFLLTGLLCLPLMTTSSVILFIKVCFKSHPQKKRRLLTVVLLTLLSFLVLAFPLNAFLLCDLIFKIDYVVPAHYCILCATLNSSVNPLLYFLVGKRKGVQFRESLVVILERVLIDQNDRQKLDSPCSKQLSNLS